MHRMNPEPLAPDHSDAADDRQPDEQPDEEEDEDNG
jgi:hypothetical protein